MDGDTTERLSQESQCPNAKKHGLLARASAFAGGVLSSIQALAGTTTCKGVQIARLKDWAIKNISPTAFTTSSMPCPIMYWLEMTATTIS